MSDTIFTRLYRGELPCAKVYEDNLVFAFMDAGQVNPGHVIVASIAPFETIVDADEATALALMCSASAARSRLPRRAAASRLAGSWPKRAPQKTQMEEGAGELASEGEEDDDWDTVTRAL